MTIFLDMERAQVVRDDSSEASPLKGSRNSQERSFPAAEKLPWPLERRKSSYVNWDLKEETRKVLIVAVGTLGF